MILSLMQGGIYLHGQVVGSRCEISIVLAIIII